MTQVLADYFFINVKFQSTQPSQAVTVLRVKGKTALGISIHTALAGCDAVRIGKQLVIL